MKLVFNILSALFIGFLLVVGALLLAPRLPVHTGIESKIVVSGSMTPAIPVGALVFVKPSASYAVGDVVTFGEDNASAAPTTHRIVGIRSENGTTWYTTKGDANNAPDSREASQNEVIGKVFLSVPYAGFVLTFARQPVGFALLIGVPALLVIIFELVSITREISNLWRGRRVRVVAKKPGKRWLSAGSVEYVRQFAMDDIFVPVRVPHVRVSGALRRYAATLSSAVAVVSIVLVVSLEGSRGTLSYFQDTEISNGNSFTAGQWVVPQPSVLAGFTQGQESPVQDTPQDTGVDSGDGANVETPTDVTRGDSTGEGDGGGLTRDTREGRDGREARGTDVTTETIVPDNTPAVLD